MVRHSSSVKEAEGPLTQQAILSKVKTSIDVVWLERRIAYLSKDFDIKIEETKAGPTYELGKFEAFTGQDDHARHEAFAVRASRSRIS